MLNATAQINVNRPGLPLSLEQYAGAGESLSIDDVTKPQGQAHFRSLSSTSTNEFAGSARWFRFVAPRFSSESLVLIVSGAPDDADMYFPRADGSYGVVSFGMRTPFNRRSFATTYTATLLAPAMRTGKPIYLRTYGATPTFDNVPPVAVQTLGAFDANQSVKLTGSFFFVGFFAAMGLVSAFLALYLRRRMFAIHAALMLVVIVWDLTEKYLAWRYFWPFASVDFPTAEAVTFSAYLAVLVLFARSFLSLDTAMPVLDRTLWVVVALNVVALFAGDRFLAAQYVLRILPFVLLPVAGVIRWWSGFREARFFVLGFASVFVVFMTAFIFTNSPASRWAIDTGIACECLFFQFAVADRILSAIRERDEAQRTSLRVKEELAENQRLSIEGLQRYNEAFARFVPQEFLTQLGREDVLRVQLGDSVSRRMSVLFSDIRGFTRMAEVLPPDRTFKFVNEYLAHVGPVIRDHDGFVDKFLGDGMLALFPDADCALDAAIELQQAVRRFNESRARSLLAPIGVGAGLHYGEVMLGTIGDQKRYETTVISDAVNVASRLEGITKMFGARIIASAELVAVLSRRSSFHLRSLCPVQIRGAERMELVYEVFDSDEPELLLHKATTLEIFESAVNAFCKDDFETGKRLFEEVVRRNPKDAPAAYFLSESISRLGQPVQ